MKKTVIILISVTFLGCKTKTDEPDILSFQGKWGVAYYFSPRFASDGCDDEIGFLPLINSRDTSLITDLSSLFDFKYGHGIVFLSRDPIVSDEIYAANTKIFVHEKGDSYHIVYWAFVKIRYHLNKKFPNQELGDLLDDTLYLKKHDLSLKYYKLGKRIIVDTAFSKKKYINPWKNPKLRLKMSKYVMPCFLLSK